MSYKTVYACLLFSLVFGYSRADEISDVKMPSTMKNAQLFHSEDGFTVVHDGNEKDIKPCFVSTELRKISPDLLGKFIAADNYLKVSKLTDADGNTVDYKLDACNRLRGGGPIAGFIGYWGTKTICYGTILAGAGAATAGAAGAVIGGATTAGTLGVGALAGSAAAPATVVGGAVAAAGGAEGAAVLTGAAVAAGGAAGVIGGIETASAGVGGFLLCCPFLP